MDWITGVVAYLAGHGVGIDGETLFIGAKAALPDVDDALTTFRSTGGASGFYGGAGSPASYVHNDTSRPNLRMPRMQAMTRAAEREDAMRQAQQIYDVLAAVSNAEIAGIWFLSIRPVHEPFEMPLDASGRVRIDCNYEALVRPRR